MKKILTNVMVWLVLALVTTSPAIAGGVAYCGGQLCAVHNGPVGQQHATTKPLVYVWLKQPHGQVVTLGLYDRQGRVIQYEGRPLLFNNSKGTIDSYNLVRQWVEATVQLGGYALVCNDQATRRVETEELRTALRLGRTDGYVFLFRQ